MKKSNLTLRRLALLLVAMVFVFAEFGLWALQMQSALAESDETDLQRRYDEAAAYFEAGEYGKAMEAFEALGDYADSRSRASESKRKWKSTSYREAIGLYNDKRYYEARDIFEALGSYEKSKNFLYNCNLQILGIEYNQAEDLFDAGEYEAAKALFDSLGNYSNSKARARAADEMIQLEQQAALELDWYNKGLAFKEAGQLEEARDAFVEAGDCEDATEQFHEVIDMIALKDVYEQAETYRQDGAYEKAILRFELLGDYEDSADQAVLTKDAWQSSVYEQATAAEESDKARAYILFVFLGDYSDSAEHADALKEQVTPEALYETATALESEGALAEAKVGFEMTGGYQDSDVRAADIQKMADYDRAVVLRKLGEEEAANDIFADLGEFNNAAAMIAPISPRFTTKQLRDDRTSPMSEVFVAPDGSQHRYRIFKGVHRWLEAKAFCEALGGHLATMTTPEENDFVYGFMRDCGYLTAYFGLSDELRSGNWIWVSGEPVEYTNWHIGEPSYSGRERYGMYFYKHTDGTWNDAHFYEDAEEDPGCSFICEWDD
ncbi:MAG: hypothetical protein E7319_05930 [Clostridiales bacterium]|nr:hypothetical protein [Clostridiales bacterium]